MTLKGTCTWSTMGQAVASCFDDTKPFPGPMMTYEKSIANALLEFTDKEIMASYQTGVT